jgi:hypothetical protein
MVPKWRHSIGTIYTCVASFQCAMSHFQMEKELLEHLNHIHLQYIVILTTKILSSLIILHAQYCTIKNVVFPPKLGTTPPEKV